MSVEAVVTPLFSKQAGVPIWDIMGSSSIGVLKSSEKKNLKYGEDQAVTTPGKPMEP
jgi:hypothetical protein